MTKLEIDRHNSKAFNSYSLLTQRNLKQALITAADKIQNKLEMELGDKGYWIYDHTTKYTVDHTHSIDSWSTSPVIDSHNMTIRISNNATNPYSGKHYVPFLLNPTWRAADTSGLTPEVWKRNKESMLSLLENHIRSALRARRDWR